MLTSLLRAWRVHTRQAEMAALAKRLGPHIARDIGIDVARTTSVLPNLKSF